MSWIDLVKALAPVIISAKVPHGDVIAPAVAKGIEEAEALKDSKSKQERLAHAVNETNIFIDAYNASATKQLDKAAINNSIASATSLVVNVANAIHRS